jgi:rhodanese-related sulfurtransferase
MDTLPRGRNLMNKKISLITTAIAIVFIGLVIIFVNKSMAKNESMDGMPGMSQNEDMKETKTAKLQSMDQAELLKYLDKSDVTIVDVREPASYKKGHIPSAINIPFTDFQKRYNELDSSKLIILVCHTGGMGEASGQLLLQQGFKHVANLSGGIAKWSGPVEN